MTVVLITGSNSGFGLATATEFLARGDDVVAGMRRPESGDELRQRALELKGRLEIVPLDVGRAESLDRAVQQSLDRFGRIDVLVNNAGISHIAAFEDTSAEMLEQIFATNVVGPLELARRVLPGMRANGQGRIVNVTAIGAVLCTPFLTAYVASKHALDAATASLDLEVRPFGIRAVSVLPGAFRTAIARNADELTDSPPYEATAGAFRSGILARMADSPSDLSAVVAAIVEGATAASPAGRAVVASEMMNQTLAPAVAELENLHHMEAERLGLT